MKGCHWLTRVMAAAALTAALMSTGCGTHSPRDAGAQGPVLAQTRPADLSELLIITQPVLDPKTGHWAVEWVTQFIDRKTGQRLAGPDLLIEWGFSEGLAVARRPGSKLCGFIDTSGGVVIPFQFAGANNFRDDRALVSIPNGAGKTQWGLIDRSGRWVVPAGRYEGLREAHDGRWAFRVG